jgi:hypothetical protein
MSDEYVVAVGREASLPPRNVLINQAWGALPVSYFQDHEDIDECSFLDLKVNKWEVNNLWAGRGVEPTIRIDILKGAALGDFMRNHDFQKSCVAYERLLVLKLDEGAEAIDEMLLLRLISVFVGIGKVYVLRQRVEEMIEGSINAIPTVAAVIEKLNGVA